MPSSILTSLLLLFGLFAAAASEDFVIYEAQTRPAEELKAAAQDVIPGARLSVLNHKIVVYGSRSQRENALRLFQQLDRKLSNFVVRLRARAAGASERSAHAVEGRVGKGGVSASSRSGVLKGRTGGKFGASGELGTVELGLEAGNAETADRSTQQLTLIDGGRAKLYTAGGLFPTDMEISVRSLGKVGARVELFQASGSSTGEQRLATSVNVVLGEWQAVGGIRKQSTGKRGELLGAAGSASESSSAVEILVERAE